MAKSTLQTIALGMQYRKVVKAYRKANAKPSSQGAIEKAAELSKAVALHEKQASALDGSSAIHLKAGRLLMEGGQAKKAIASLSQALKTARKGSFDEANALIATACALYRNGSRKEAKQAFSKAYPLLSQSNSFPQWANSYGDSVAECLEFLMNNNLFAETASFGAKVFPFAQKWRRPIVLSYEAAAEGLLGNSEKAGELRQSALASLTGAAKGVGARLKAKSYFLLAISCGYAPEALPLYEKALCLQEELLGQGHYGTLSTLEAISDTQFFLEEFEEARRSLARALEIAVRCFGARSGRTASIFVKLAQTHCEEENYQPASMLYEKAAVIYSGLKGMNSSAAEAAKACAACHFALGSDSLALQWSRIADEMKKA